MSSPSVRAAEPHTEAASQAQVSPRGSVPTPRRRVPSRRTLVALSQIGVTVVLLGIWELVTVTGLVDQFWVSKPSRIMVGLFEFLGTAAGWKAIVVTLWEALGGLFAGTVLGVLSGFLITRVRFVYDVLIPAVAVLNSVPRLALTPLFIVWFGVGTTSKVVMVFTLVYFIMLVNTIGGIRAVDDELITVARLLGANRNTITRTVVMPSIAPWLFAGLKVSLGNAFAGAVVAEMMAGSGGLGYLVSYSAALLDLTSVFVAVILVMVLSYLADQALDRIEARVLRWRPSEGRIG